MRFAFYDAGFHAKAALIGFGSSGKTTLFQLMTSARETARAAHGKGEATIGISKVPDDRLDRLTAMYNPKKRVPATVEFSDLAAAGGAGGAQTLVDVAAYKNADALVHVVRAFRRSGVPHPSGTVNPARDAQAMEDELILADLGVAERRLERIEKELKKNRTPELERERDVLTICRARSRGRASASRARSPGRRPQAPARISVSIRQAPAHRHQPGRKAAAADGEGGAALDQAAEARGLTPFLSRARTVAVAVCAKIELEIAQLEAADARGLSRGPRARPSRGSIA